MRQIRHMLRLAHDGVSAREIGPTLGIARSTVQDNLARARLRAAEATLRAAGRELSVEDALRMAGMEEDSEPSDDGPLHEHSLVELLRQCRGLEADHSGASRTMADAVLDRLIHNANRIELSGDGLRKHRPADQPA